jgi:subtilisin family serine protease
MLDAQADLRGAAGLRGKAQRGAWVHARVSDTVRRTQPAVIAAIEKAGATHRDFSVVNAVLVEGGDLDLLRMLAGRADVRHIHANPRVALQRPVREAPHPRIAGIEPNIIQTGAPAQYWAAGFTGRGVIVASQDTGVEWTHPALRTHYLGVTQSGRVARLSLARRDTQRRRNLRPGFAGPLRRRRSRHADDGRHRG